MTWTLRIPEHFDGATLKQWTKRDGDRIAAGESIAILEIEEPPGPVPLVSDRPGVVLRTLLGTGIRLGEGSPLAILGDEGEQLGWDPAQIRCVRTTILRRCDECGNEYPLNGLVDRARCTGCGIEDGRLQMSVVHGRARNLERREADLALQILRLGHLSAR